jgi:hypothetical protein
MGNGKKRVVGAEEVLCYRKTGPSRSTVWKYYLQWRQAQNPPLPIRCDNPVCRYHTEPLVWNGKPLKPILDHIEGNNSDNRPKMLRLLCPNCDSQLPTRGGANKGRIEKSEGGFCKVAKDGKRAYVLPTEPGKFSLTGSEVKFTVGRASDSGDDPQEVS